MLAGKEDKEKETEEIIWNPLKIFESGF